MREFHIQPVAPVTAAGSTWGDQLSGGDGSEGSPYGSFQELIASETIADNDVFYLDTETNDIPNYGPVTIDGISSPTITRKPGLTGVQRMICGYPIDFDDSTRTTSGTYDTFRTEANAAGHYTNQPSGVTQDWNTRVNARGERYGMVEENLVGLVDIRTNYGWWWNSSTKAVYVSVPAGTTTMVGIEVIIGVEGNTLLINDCPDATVSFIRAEHSLEASSNSSYGSTLCSAFKPVSFLAYTRTINRANRRCGSGL